MKEAFGPGGLETFEERCKIRRRLLPRSSSCRTQGKPKVAVKWKGAALLLPPRIPHRTRCLPSLTRRSNLCCHGASCSRFMGAEDCGGMERPGLALMWLSAKTTPARSLGSRPGCRADIPDTAGAPLQVVLVGLKEEPGSNRKLGMHWTISCLSLEALCSWQLSPATCLQDGCCQLRRQHTRAPVYNAERSSQAGNGTQKSCSQCHFHATRHPD